MSATAEAIPERSPSERRELTTVFAALLLGMLLAALDQTIVSTALPTIVGDLGGLEHIAWVVTSYLLAATISTPLYGKVGDMIGRKPVFMTAIVIFLAGSVLAGLSQTMLQLILFRGLQGLGAGGLMVTAQAIVGDLVSPRERGRYMGLFGAVFAVASVVGPLLGGFLVDQLSWRWVFYVNLPIGAIALLMIATRLHLPQTHVRHAVDWLGAAFLAGGASSAILVMTWGGAQYAWTSGLIIGLSAAAALLLALFLLQERRAAEPVLPLRLFSSRVFSVANATGFFVGLAMFGTISFLPLYLQVVDGASATGSGLRMLPLMAGVLIASIGSGQLITRIGRYRIFPILGTALLTVGMLLLSKLDAGTSSLVISIDMAIVGVGIGLVMQVVVLVVQNDVAPSEIGVATSTATFTRSIGGSAGVALFGAIFAGRLGSELDKLPPAVQKVSAGGVQLDPNQIHALPPELLNGVLHAFSKALDHTFFWGAVLAAISFAVTWALPEVRLRKTSGVQELEGDEGTKIAAGAPAGIPVGERP